MTAGKDPRTASESTAFTTEYGRRIEQRFPGFRAIFCKWKLEDLAPRLSDVDARIVCEDPGPVEWMELDEVVGRIHLDMVVEHPDWCRMAEHNPGIALSRRELCDDSAYVTDMRQWTFHYGDEATFALMERYLAGKPWSLEDESFHLRRFLYFYAPYDHDIDPPINIEAGLVPDYALHSRVKHYFLPAVMSAVSILDRTTYRGKHDALERCLELFPGEPVLERTREIVALRYAVPERDDPERLRRYEEDCFLFLGRLLRDGVTDRVESVEPRYRTSAAEMKRVLSARPACPRMVMSDTVRFARTRAGRYHFYLHAPAYFDVSNLLGLQESNWLRKLFTKSYFQAYARIRWQDDEFDLARILDRIEGTLVTRAERRVVEEMFDIAWNRLVNQKTETHRIFQRAYDLFRSYFLVLDRIHEDAEACLAGR